jgi:hypothetical protein
VTSNRSARSAERVGRAALSISDVVGRTIQRESDPRPGDLLYGAVTLSVFDQSVPVMSALLARPSFADQCMISPVATPVW